MDKLVLVENGIEYDLTQVGQILGEPIFIIERDRDLDTTQIFLKGDTK